jgi:hypothetical protein
MDTIAIEILPDGTVKLSTDKVSMPNHGSAEALLRDVARLCGGKVDSKRKHGHAGHHHHEHEHNHEGHSH